MASRFKVRLKLATLALLLTLSACGQKGDLYRTDTRQQSVATAAIVAV
ncbi:MAG: hypothetical protein HW386_2368 [Gammaproteobacteria bacterium]|nr:hypothetical protein [Gammaproteobacteria bacterium]